MIRCSSPFAKPKIYEFLEAEGYSSAVRLPTNPILQKSIAHLLTRPVGRPPNHVQRYYASIRYRAVTWSKPRRVVAKVEWHPAELCPRVGFRCVPRKPVCALRTRIGQWVGFSIAKSA